MDADLSHDPCVIPSLLREIRVGADLAIGSRYVPGGATPNWPARRRLLSRAGTCTQGGCSGSARPTRLRAIARIAQRRSKRSTLRTTHATGYGFQIELAYRVSRGGGRISEVPIVFHDRTRGTSKMSTRIAIEALALVTWWAFRDRVLGSAPCSSLGARADRARRVGYRSARCRVDARARFGLLASVVAAATAVTVATGAGGATAATDRAARPRSRS